eukprot:6213857-Pleurochrysis_carterae.AAC.1
MACAATVAGLLEASQGLQVRLQRHVVNDGAVAPAQLALDGADARKVRRELELNSHDDRVAANLQRELLGEQDVLDAVNVGGEELQKAGAVILKANAKCQQSEGKTRLRLQLGVLDDDRDKLS